MSSLSLIWSVELCLHTELGTIDHKLDFDLPTLSIDMPHVPITIRNRQVPRFGYSIQSHNVWILQKAESALWLPSK